MTIPDNRLVTDYRTLADDIAGRYGIPTGPFLDSRTPGHPLFDPRNIEYDPRNLGVSGQGPGADWAPDSVRRGFTAGIAGEKISPAPLIPGVTDWWERLSSWLMARGLNIGAGLLGVLLVAAAVFMLVKGGSAGALQERVLQGATG